MQNKIIDHIIKTSDLRGKLPDDFITLFMLEPQNLRMNLQSCSSYMNKRCTLFLCDKNHCCTNTVNNNRFFCDQHIMFNNFLHSKTKYMFKCYDFIDWIHLDIIYIESWLKIKQTICKELNDLLEIYSLNQNKELDFVRKQAQFEVSYMLYHQSLMTDKLLKFVKNKTNDNIVDDACEILLKMLEGNKKRVTFKNENDEVIIKKIRYE